MLEEGQRRAADLVSQTAGEPIDGRGTRFWVERSLAEACHLAVVVALVVVGARHFQDVSAGMAAATLYLLLPYIAFHITQIHHVRPTALLLWAVVFYRRPVVAGPSSERRPAACSSPPLRCRLDQLLLEGRGPAVPWRAGVTAGTSVAVAMLLLWWDGSLAATVRQTFAQPDWLPWRVPQAESFWTGVHWAYRIPVFIVYVFFVAVTAFWPTPKDLSHLLALLAAVLLGIQFWYADRGGVYVLWYLPILPSVIFRPNLSDRRPPIPETEDDFVVRTIRAMRRVVNRFMQRPQPVAQ